MNAIEPPPPGAVECHLAPFAFFGMEEPGDLFNRDYARCQLEQRIEASGFSVGIDWTFGSFQIAIRGQTGKSASPPMLPWKIARFNWSKYDLPDADHLKAFLEDIWERLQSDLRTKLYAGKLAMWACVEHPSAPLERIPSHAWMNYPITDWEVGRGESASGRHVFSIHYAWAEADVAAAKSANADGGRALSEKAETASPYHTGGPGRPTPMDFVVQEFERRVREKTIEKTVTTQGVVLHAWCKQNHREIATPSPKTIENKIRSHFSKAKAIKPP